VIFDAAVSKICPERLQLDAMRAGLGLHCEAACSTPGVFSLDVDVAPKKEDVSQIYRQTCAFFSASKPRHACDINVLLDPCSVKTAVRLATADLTASKYALLHFITAPSMHKGCSDVPTSALS
jgi:hypothetical protein